MQIRAFIALIALFLLFTASPVLSSSVSIPFDILITLNRIDKTAADIYRIAEPYLSAHQKDALLNMPKSVFGGTEWMDFEKPIRIGIKLYMPSPLVIASVPAKRKNSIVEQRLNARFQKGCYIFLPKGEKRNPEPELERFLTEPPARTDPYAFSFKAKAPALFGDLKESSARLSGVIDAMKEEDLKEIGLSKEEAKKILKALLSYIEDLDEISYRMDLTGDLLTTIAEIKSFPGSRLSRILSKKEGDFFLSDYSPQGHITFMSSNLNNQLMAEEFMPLLYPFSRWIGINAKKLLLINRHFTGEMAGGISLMPGYGIKSEMILVLKEKSSKKNFLEDIYLPWLLEQNRSLQQEGIIGDFFFSKKDETSINGVRVFGMIMKSNSFQDGFKWEFRLAQSGRFLLIAPNDKKIKEMIRLSKTFKKKRSKRPVLVASADLGAIADYASPGFIGVSMDIIEGKAFIKSRMEIGKWIAFSRRAKGKAIVKRARIEKGLKQPPVKKMPDIEKDHLKIGEMLVSMGEDRAAIYHLKKAAASNPRSARIYFLLGVSYSETGKLDLAFKAFNRAISLSPYTGAFYYGRARAHLRAGNQKEAERDLKKASDLGY